LTMIVRDTDKVEEASDEHLSWMLQAMEMVCANTYAGIVHIHSYAGGGSPCG